MKVPGWGSAKGLRREGPHVPTKPVGSWVPNRSVPTTPRPTCTPDLRIGEGSDRYPSPGTPPPDPTGAHRSRPPCNAGERKSFRRPSTYRGAHDTKESLPTPSTLPYGSCADLRQVSESTNDLETRVVPSPNVTVIVAARHPGGPRSVDAKCLGG